MSPPVQSIGLDCPQISWSEDGDPYSLQYGDCYYPAGNSLAVSIHTFLEPNNLPYAWKHKTQFVIGETGFGTGLNFFVTLQAWHTDPAATGILHFVSFEKHPLSADSIRRAMSRWPELGMYVDALYRQYPIRSKGLFRILFPEFNATLTLCFDDALRALRNFSGHMNCWYLDGFAPSRNTDLWSDKLIDEIAQHSVPGATLATFSSAGSVRRALGRAGFKVTKTPGYGSKREHIKAEFTETIPADSLRPSHCFISKKPSSALIIGAGIAGTALAYSLSLRGINVTVIEKNSGPGSGSSGNPGGIIMPYLSSFGGCPHSFFISGFCFATRMMSHLARGSTDRIWNQCGVIQLPSNGRIRRLIDHFEDLRPPAELMQHLHSHKLSRAAGLEIASNGLFYPEAGIVSPRNACKHYLSSFPITFLHGRCAKHIEEHADRCVLELDNGQSCTADIAVLAAAHESQALINAEWLHMEKVAGQIAYSTATTNSKKLKVGLCSDGYLLPYSDETHVIGSTYDYNDYSENVIFARNKTLVEKANSWSDSLDLLPTTAGRTAIRSTLYDRLPLVGPLADHSSDAEPRLFISAGFGSRGFTTAPLSAELLAGYICNEPLPVLADVADALHPDRLRIRAGKKLAVEPGSPDGTF